MSQNIKDERGKQYGPWLVMKRVFPNYPPNHTAVWQCKCVKCGYIRTHTGNHLRFGHYGKCEKCGCKG